MNFSTEQYAETLLVTMLNFFICFFGLFLNSLAIIIVQRSPQFVGHSYGTMSTNHLFLNIGNLLVYFLWVTPATYTQSPYASTSLIGKILGQIHLFFWISLVYSHLALSLNRLVYLHFPTKSHSIFSHHMCQFIVFSNLVLAFFHVVPLFWYQDCYLTYDPATWIWSMSLTKYGATFKLFVIQYLCEFVSALNFLINLSTWITISDEKAKRHPVETKFLKGKLWKSFGFLAAATVSNLLIGWVGERWQRYLMTCFIWQGYYLIDGLIMLYLHFHRKLLAPIETSMGTHHHPLPSFIHVDTHHSLPHHSPFHHNVHFSKVDTY